MEKTPALKNLIHQYQPQLLETLRQSIRIASVEGQPLPGAPYGEQVNLALEHALETARGMGFTTGNIDGQVGWCEYGAGEEMIAVLGHLDVVPAGDGWHHDPFGAEMSQECVWGRGAMDDKGPIFACLYGLKALADAGVPLKRRVRIIFGTNEESGSADIPHYTAREELPVLAFSPDGEFPVIFAEKGIINVELSAACGTEPAAVVLESLHGGTAANAVPDICTALLYGADLNAEALERTCAGLGFPHNIARRVDGKLELTMFGRSAHGSTPEKGVNAAAHMLRVLYTLPLGDGVDRLVRFLTEKIGEETDGSSLHIALQDDIGALTLNLGLLDYKDGTLSAVLNIRFPVTKSCEDVTKPLECQAGEAGILCRVLSCTLPLYHAPQEPLLSKLMDVYHEYRSGGQPIAIGGGTYAKELPNTVAFGPLFPGRQDLNHQADEYISLEELEELTQIYARAIEVLANMDRQESGKKCGLD